MRHPERSSPLAGDSRGEGADRYTHKEGAAGDNTSSSRAPLTSRRKQTTTDDDNLQQQFRSALRYSSVEATDMSNQDSSRQQPWARHEKRRGTGSTRGQSTVRRCVRKGRCE